METENSLVGRKMRGFPFISKNGLSYQYGMEKWIGKTGIIVDEMEDRVKVDFGGTYWWYPKEFVYKKLIEQEPSSSEIPNTSKPLSHDEVKQMIDKYGWAEYMKTLDQKDIDKVAKLWLESNYLVKPLSLQEATEQWKKAMELQKDMFLKQLSSKEEAHKIELSNYAYQMDIAKRERDKAESLLNEKEERIRELEEDDEQWNKFAEAVSGLFGLKKDSPISHYKHNLEALKEQLKAAEALIRNAEYHTTIKYQEQLRSFHESLKSKS